MNRLEALGSPPLDVGDKRAENEQDAVVIVWCYPRSGGNRGCLQHPLQLRAR